MMVLGAKHNDDSWSRQLCFGFAIVVIPKKKGIGLDGQGITHGRGNTALTSALLARPRGWGKDDDDAKTASHTRGAGTRTTRSAIFFCTC